MQICYHSELDVGESQIRSSLRQDVVWLLLSVIDQPAPNLAHFLLGFDIRKPISRTTLQDAGIYVEGINFIAGKCLFKSSMIRHRE